MNGNEAERKEEKLINESWFKNKRNITVSILSVLLCTSIGFNIYYARTGTVDHAGNIRDILTEFESIMGKQYDSLDSALNDIRGAIELAEQLDSQWGRIGELARSANAGLIELGETMEGAAATISELIERQRRINEAYRRFFEDYRRLEEAISLR